MRAAGVVARPARIGRRLVAASRAHDASLGRIALRAFHLSRRGWHLGDAALLGLLDPAEGRARERWAVRRGEFEAVQEHLNPAGAVAAIQDKRRFARECARLGLRAIPVLAALERGDDPLATGRDWTARLRDAAPPEFVVKPISGQRGVGVRPLSRARDGVVDDVGHHIPWADLGRELAAGPGETLLLQPRARPRADVTALSGSRALQTYRVVTLLDGTGRAEVLYALLRLAVGVAAVDGFRSGDSGSTGNMIVRVEPDGTLATPVVADPSGFGLRQVPRHPTSGVYLAGLQAPGWDEARALAVAAAEAFTDLATVGWDVAITDAGAVLVEANGWWGASADPDGRLLPVLRALRKAAVTGGARARRPAG